MNELTVPLEVFGDAQVEDIEGSKGPDSVMGGVFRVKQYVKDEDMKPNFSPRNAAFDQPYQYITSRNRDKHRTTLYQDMTWADANRAFLFQVAGCNLDCPYCYRDCIGMPPEDKIRHYTTEKMAQEIGEYMVDCERRGMRTGTLRISGGEPLIYPAWLYEFIGEMYESRMLWLDTNGTIIPNKFLLSRIRDTLTGVCLCFKPGVDPVDLDHQLDVAEIYIKHGVEIFFYYTSWDGEPEESTRLLEYVLERLYAIHKYAPLRLSIDEIKRYESNTARFDYDARTLRSMFNVRRAAYMRFCEEHYEKCEIWLPSDQLSLKPKYSWE